MFSLPARSTKAFTMLELIVVIVILGILAAIAIPTFKKVITKSQDASAEQTLKALDREAKALAAFDNRPVSSADYAAAAEDLNVALDAGVYAARTFDVASIADADTFGVKIEAGTVGVSMVSKSGNCVMLNTTTTSNAATVFSWGALGTNCSGATAVAGPSAADPGYAARAVVTLAGSDAGSTDGTGPGAQFHAPRGSASDGTYLYVVDFSGNKIRKVDPASGAVTTLAGSGAAGSANGTGTAASFDRPTDVATDGTNLYVAEWAANHIRKVVIATGVVTTLAGSGGYGSTDATGTAASFANPNGVVLVGRKLYVTEQPRIRVVDVDTQVVSTLAGSATVGALEGVGTAAQFSNPVGIASDGSNLYVSDAGNHRIRKVNLASTEVTTLAGSTSGFADGSGSAASFFNPHGVVFSGGSVYVADTNSHRIRKVDVASGGVTTIAGSGAASSVDGSSSAASFHSPLGITTHGTDLFVTDNGSHRLRRIS